MSRRPAWAGVWVLLALALGTGGARAQYGDWHQDAPGVQHRITVADLPAPFASRSSSNSPSIVARPAGAMPKVPPGFSVGLFADGLSGPRVIRVAPNGDIFVAESTAGQIRVLRADDLAAHPSLTRVFASGLDLPFGIAFYPPGPDPRFVYVAENNRVVRFPYRAGDLQAEGAPQVVVARLSATAGHHWTRDLVFSADGSRMFVSVGSGSNDAEGMGRTPPPEMAGSAVGEAWGNEAHRATVLDFAPDGSDGRILATGLRNCSGLGRQPQTGAIWCVTNERDGLGDNLPPDYATRVAQGAFYGWPWFYIGDHPDPHRPGDRPDLASRVALPDVLIQPHSAPLGIAFYDGHGPAAFGADYQGDAFVTLHGSWNRRTRTGYKVIRIHLGEGVPAPGAGYEDFLTGFVVNDDAVFGRPVGIAVAHDGALLVGDDGNGTIWRIAPTGH